MALLSSEPTWHTFPLSSNASCRASELLNSLGLASPKLSSFHLSHFKMGSSFLTSPHCFWPAFSPNLLLSCSCHFSTLHTPLSPCLFLAPQDWG